MHSPEELLLPYLVDDGRTLRTLRAKVVTHVGSIRAAAAQNELLPVDLAEVIARRLTELLDQHDAMPRDHQALVLAAARYFVSNTDLRPDTQDAMGLDDDLLVLNHVVQVIGRPELVVVDA